MKPCCLTNITVSTFAWCFVIAKCIVICFDVRWQLSCRRKHRKIRFQLTQYFLCSSYNTIINRMQSEDNDISSQCHCVPLQYLHKDAVWMHYYLPISVKSRQQVWFIEESHAVRFLFQHFDYTTTTVPLSCSSCTRIAVQVPVHISLVYNQ